MTGFPFKPAKAVAHLRAVDPALAAIIETVGPFRMQLKVSRSLFGSLAEAIVYQQLSNKAAATIYGRVEALYPRASDGFTPRHILKTVSRSLGDTKPATVSPHSRIFASTAGSLGAWFHAMIGKNAGSSTMAGEASEMTNTITAAM